MNTGAASPNATLETHLLAQDERTLRLFWHRLRWHVVSKALPRRAAFDLLDIGAGAGFAGEYLRREFPDGRYFFIESLPSLERRLESRFGADRNLRAARSFAGTRYVLLLDVLEHQQDDVAFLRALVDKMESGAQLIITVPALSALWSEWDDILGHFRRYDAASLRRVVDGFSARIVDLSYLFPELAPLGLVRRALPRRAGGKGSGEFPELPAALNEALYWTGRCTMLLRGLIPFGSSLCMRLEKR